MKIAVVGNSHAGPIYRAWKLLKSTRSWDLEFFIERSMGKHPLEVVGGGERVIFEDIFLMSDEPLVVEQYDLVVVVGLGMGFHPLMARYIDVRADKHVFDDDVTLVSDACFRQLLIDTLTATKGLRVLRSLNELAVQRAVAITQPFAAEWVRSADSQVGMLYQLIDSNGDGIGLKSDFREALASIAGVDVLSQPPSTVVDEIYTRNRFALGDPADTSNGSYFARGDYFHGNAEWGMEVLTTLGNFLASDN